MMIIASLLIFDRDLEVGVTMGENSINSIEVQSHVTATSGYYFTKKSGDAAVNSEVTMEKIDEDGICRAPSASPC